jgi:FLVCR family MFS transporter 7
MNIVSAMAWPWFGPIANNSLFANQTSLYTANTVYPVVKEFDFTLDGVNWLGNIVACVYLPAALIMPTIISRYGIRKCVRRFQYRPLQSTVARRP